MSKELPEIHDTIYSTNFPNRTYIVTDIDTYDEKLILLDVQRHTSDSLMFSSWRSDMGNWSISVPKESAKQIGGTHYEDMKIQPWEVIEKAGLDFWEGNVIKYVMRYRTKNGLEDLKKAKHYLDYLIAREETREG